MVAIGFRHQRVLILCFCGVVLGVLLSALVLPTKYRAETKLLVKRERVDPMVSPEQNAPMMFHDTVGEEEINSEVELIQSQDVLQKVVTTCGLDKKKFLSGIAASRGDAAEPHGPGHLRIASGTAARSDQEDEHHQHRAMNRTSRSWRSRC